MKVSVVVPTYRPDRYEDFTECVDALLAQSYDDIEIVLIIDGSQTMLDRAEEEYGDRDGVMTYLVHEDAGPISRANMGVVQSSGDLVAITDLDAVADEAWIEELVAAYERHDAISVGGRIDPLWVAGKAEYIPEEFYFLIGATHPGVPDQEQEVRNTFGANIAFDREAYMRLGGMKLGGIEPSQVQGRETEFCARMRKEYGRGVIYNPDAVVEHRIYERRTELGWLVRRAFWQGYSKRAMEKLVPNSGDEESAYLRALLGSYIPGRIGKLLRRPSKQKLSQFLTLFLLLGLTGLGYLYGILRWR